MLIEASTRLDAVSRVFMGEVREELLKAEQLVQAVKGNADSEPLESLLSRIGGMRDQLKLHFRNATSCREKCVQIAEGLGK
jgi:hypothetical protein